MKKLAFLVVGIIAAAGCSRDGVEETTASPLPTEGVTSSQLRAFQAFEHATNQSWRWLQHAELETPMHLSAPRTGKRLLPKGADAVKTTLDLLSESRELFKMRAPELELAPLHAEVDELGMTHARFQQTTHGVPVVGAELMARYDRAGRLASIDANYIPGLDRVDVNPTILPAEALAVAKADVLARSVVAEAALEPHQGKLVVHVRDNVARLGYQYEVRALAAAKPAIWVVTVDAKTGRALHRYDNLQTIQGQGAGVLGDRKQFEVAADSAGFVMTDAASGVQIKTYTAAQEQTTPGTQVTSDSATSWDTDVPGAGAAVDAHFNAAAVFKYYKDTHQRNAIDGRGGPLVSTAHFGVGYDNAAWDGTGMVYGDGGSIFRALSVSLDVVGHEFTHGVTERTSNLVYENQSGALNEAVSDIFGAFIEHANKPDDAKNWIMGEEVLKRGGAIRDMKNPAAGADPQPSHMSKFVNTQQDNGGVHINSGIINNAAFLMTVGGVNPVSKIEVKFGIGWEKSEKLWYRANTKYFLRTTNFGQAAQAVLQAAKDIGLSDAETNIIDCAFKATGIAQGTCATIVNPQSSTLSTDVPAEEGSSAEDEGASEEESAPAPAPARRRRVVTQQSGCNATGTSTDLGPIAAMLAAVFALAATRRKPR